MAFKSRFADKMKNIGNQSKGATDERFWTEDYTQKGSYKIRPTVDKNNVRFFEYKEHVVKYMDGGREKEYKFVCPKLIGENCPVCDAFNAAFRAEKESEKERLKKYVKSKTKRITNIRVIENKLNEEQKGKFYLFNINGVVNKLFDEQSKDKDETSADDEKLDFDPFDPVYGASLLYAYQPAKSKNDFPTWNGTKFMSKIDNILGKTLGNPTDYEEDEWNKMAIAFQDEHFEKVEKVLREKSHELAKYEEEIKQLCPNEDDIMKQIGHILFGSAVKKDKKEELYEDDSDFEDDIEQDVKETNKKNVDKKPKKEEDAGFDDDDDFEQEVKREKRTVRKEVELDDEDDSSSEKVLDDEEDDMPF